MLLLSLLLFLRLVVDFLSSLDLQNCRWINGHKKSRWFLVCLLLRLVIFFLSFLSFDWRIALWIGLLVADLDVPALTAHRHLSDSVRILLQMALLAVYQDVLHFVSRVMRNLKVSSHA